MALRNATTHYAQQVELRGRLDTLGHHSDGQAVGKIDDRRDDRRDFGVVGHLLHERFVDLDHVDGEVAQMR